MPIHFRIIKQLNLYNNNKRDQITWKRIEIVCVSRVCINKQPL